ncbi:WXG100 family type VII secretion target, partial [Salmonella enterica subsp. enterica serovar Istanbul]|nr:WXG100 family type VII secretion target [Salmonella enterica subsp. enterica serovar Istanbul]
QFNMVASEWRRTQQQMELSLEAMKQALTQASTVYADAEMQATRLFATS